MARFGPRPRPIGQRFWKYVRKEPGGCWIWTGAKGGGYGRASVDGKPVLATRVSWMLTKGTIPDGMEVCHDCPGGDNPACVNPDHLFLGTHAQNMQDAMRKGRMSSGAKHSAIMLPLVQHGEQRPLAKLTDAIVVAMRQRSRAGETSRALAEEFGVNQSTVSKAIRALTWRHV